MGAIFQQLNRRSDADHEDVRWALSTASALWAKGALEDAVKWLRRAGTAATDADDDLRAVEIFKAAADMQAQLEAASESRPPTAATPRSSRLPPPLPTAKKSPPPATARKLPPPPNGRTTLRPAPSPPRPQHHAQAAQAIEKSPQRTPTRRAAERPEEVRAMRIAVYAGTSPGEVCISPVPVGSDVPEGAIGAVLVPMDAAEMHDLRLMLERRTTH